ncbi:hypothetical protein KKE26_08185 [bacterium]|nr:hypothetical protein [bacterium]MBU1752314.1 hypothetical protein [bacterium]
MPAVTVDLPLERIAQTLQTLTSGEIETLEIMFNPELKTQLKQRWKMGKKEFEEGKTITTQELFEES